MLLRYRRASVIAVALTLIVAGCDWPMLGYGSSRSGFSPDTSISVADVSSGGFTSRWIANTGPFSGQTSSSSPAVANGVVYVGSGDHNLYALDAKTGTKLWTGPTGDRVDSSPTVIGGVVYVGSNDGKTYAFDAAGNTNCGGTPKTCAPLWTAAVGGDSSPAVANGVLYMVWAGKLYAFDAIGNTSCSGSPKTCAPLWTANVPSFTVRLESPTVANGIVYVANDGIPDARIYAFDATGGTECLGTPKVCSPLWTTTPLGSGSLFRTPVVVNGVVHGASDDGNLRAYDAVGITGCSAPPKTCAPLWTAVTGSDPLYSGLYAAVANGIVYVNSQDGKLYTFDATGTAGCSGTPKTCTPLWTAAAGTHMYSSPVVANGVVYVGSWDQYLSAFDATGTTNCSGTPKTCTPLSRRLSGGGITASPAVANGLVYVDTFNSASPPLFPGRLVAFGIATTSPR